MSVKLLPYEAAIALGSNLNQPEKQIIAALRALARQPDLNIRQMSSLYVTKPIGFLEQPDFINAVIWVETCLSPPELLKRLQDQEQAQKRKRDIKHGPRTLDLDLLFYEQEVWHTPELTLPHPGLYDRAFVLYPLFEIAPDLILPNGQALKELLKSRPSTDIYPLRTITVHELELSPHI